VKTVENIVAVYLITNCDDISKTLINELVTICDQFKKTILPKAYRMYASSDTHLSDGFMQN
jgi:hypothetical protein